MNRNQLITLLLILACSLSSCEKDDLCIPEDNATPRMIIVFVDARNQLLRKPVESLQVFETDGDTAVPLDADGSLTLTQVDSIAIPLRIDQLNTEFNFVRTLNAADNGDLVNFIYEQQDIYINRACGFKSNFSDLEADQQIVAPADRWITGVIIRNEDVTSNNDIHVEIRH